MPIGASSSSYSSSSKECVDMLLSFLAACVVTARICAAAGPVLSEQHLISWCQDQKRFNDKVLADLGPFDYAYQFMREYSYSPELFVLYDCDDQPSILFICTVVFTPVDVKPPDLSPTPVIFKIMRDWVETKNVPLKNLP
ncbi:hypothetical protein BT96DRAFT_999259 [Gymnopus androsaceus JB14]|uniref:Uncharacterized protein n=1 Tax=Gymnopus androsaceus JB14 TaxID=1447944 RepID=A0A6A4H8I9_9AGAR|nr:hypothetical protein BT96DRAFT_999259 [Gymnopus androsaceus JB14]